jgi:glycosyltransferase involved in cell wall biosynthesis
MRVGAIPRPLFVAVVTETYPPEVNGVARTIGVMVRLLQGRGHRVEVIRPRQGRGDVAAQDQAYAELLRPGLPIPKYGELRLGLPAKRALLARWREARPDVVQVVTEGPLGWSAVTAARKLGIPVVSEFHTNFHTYSRHYGLGALSGAVASYLRSLHNRSDCTLVPTDELAQTLAAVGYRELRVVGRGIDTELFSPARRSVALRARWGCLGDEPVAIHVGRLAPEKGLDLFVAAALAARQADPRTRIVLVGDGPAGRALRTRHPDFVYAGMRHGTDLAAHYASADLLLFPSTTETFGNVTTEALASGLAVSAFDYAAARQHIRHDVSGLLAPPGDRHAFIVNAARLAAQPALRTRLGTAAATVGAMLSWDRVVDELEAVFRDLIDRYRRRPSPAPGIAPRPARNDRAAS